MSGYLPPLKFADSNVQMGLLTKGILIAGRSRTPCSIITLPRGQHCAARLRGCPPLDLSSSRSRGMPPQAFGTTASLRSVCPGSAYSLVLVLARLRSEIRTLPSFSPVVEARRASNSALDRGVAWGEDVGNAALAVRRGSFWRKMNDYPRGRFRGGKLAKLAPKRCSKIPPTLLLLAWTPFKHIYTIILD